MHCKICGKRFTLRKKRVYLVMGPSEFLTSSKLRSIFEATDCPRCGCQMVLNKREMELVQDASKENEG